MTNASRRSADSLLDPLFERFRRGDPDTIARAVRQAAVVVGLHGYAIPAQQRPDLVQQVIAEVWEVIRSAGFETERAFDAFVRTQAYWRCIDWMRRKRTDLPLDPETGARSNPPDEQLLVKERRQLGREVFRSIRKPCRDLFRMHAGQGLTYRQIGEVLGRSEGALRVLMVDCLKEARKLLARIQRRRTSAGRRRRAR